MKVNTEKEIADAILRDCATDVEKIEQDGFSRRVLVPLAAMIAKGRVAGMPDEVKEAFRRRNVELKKSAQILENLPHVAMRQYLKPRAEWARKNSLEIEQLLRSRGRKDHDEGIAVLVEVIHRFKKDFKCWEALSRVLEKAYIAAGVDENRTDHITGDMLRKIAKRRNTP